MKAICAVNDGDKKNVGIEKAVDNLSNENVIFHWLVLRRKCCLDETRLSRIGKSKGLENSESYEEMINWYYLRK